MKSGRQKDCQLLTTPLKIPPMKKSKFSVSEVVPYYNEAANIPLMVSGLQKHLGTYSYEIILVDDGSSDPSQEVYGKLAKGHDGLKFIRFTRNFGHQAALQAGICHAKEMPL